MKNILVLISLYLLLTSCNSNTSHDLSTSLSFKIEDQIKIELDSVTKPETQCLELVDDYLYFYNQLNKSINQYSLNSNSYKSTPLFFEGPNSIGKVNGFRVFNDTSYLITASWFKGFAVIDHNGSIVEKKRFIPDESASLLNPENSSYYRNKIIFENEGMYIGNVIGGNWMSLDQEDLNNAPIEHWYDAKNDSLYPMDVYYPENYLQNGKQSLYHSRIKVGNKMVYSFSYSHDIVVYEVENGKVMDKTIHNIKFGDLDEFDGESVPKDVNEALSTVLKKADYRSLYFDPVNRWYYRIGYLPETDQSMENTNKFQLMRNRSQPFLIVLDESFSKVGELLLPKETYNANMSFVRDGGLYVARSHYWNPDAGEDFLIFDQFKISNND